MWKIKKFVLEYSRHQKAFHIQTKEERYAGPENGYVLVDSFETYEQCSR